MMNYPFSRIANVIKAMCIYRIQKWAYLLDTPRPHESHALLYFIEIT